MIRYIELERSGARDDRIRSSNPDAGWNCRRRSGAAGRAGPHPARIHLTGIGGIRPVHRGVGARLGGEGYSVLLPNVFYRTGRPPLFDFTPVIGEERTMK